MINPWSRAGGTVPLEDEDNILAAALERVSNLLGGRNSHAHSLRKRSLKRELLGREIASQLVHGRSSGVMHSRSTPNTVGDVSLIIITLNEERCLPRLLRSIADQEGVNSELDVIIVDGRSSDATVRLARGFTQLLPGLRVLTSDPDPGAQRNAGARAALHEALLFLDADVTLPSNTLQRMSRIDVSKPSVVGIRHTANDMTKTDHVLLAFTHALIVGAGILRRPALNGDFMYTTKYTHFQIVGGFVENSLLGEDTNYGLNAVKNGASYRFIWRPAIVADPRRVQLQGRASLLLIWVSAYLRNVVHNETTPKDSGIYYPYGHYVRRHERGQ